MHRKAQKLFYGLAIFALLSALFVMQEGGPVEIRNLKSEIREQIRLGFWQALGDQPLFESFEIVWRGVEGFYNQSADEMLALIEPTPAEDDMNEVIAKAWKTMTIDYNYDRSAKDDRGKIAGLLIEGKFMQEEPLANIVPEGNSKSEIPRLPDGQGNLEQISNFQFQVSNPSVLGESVEPADGPNGWVTIQDNYTGKLYCLAIYNGEVNKYMGPCKRDDYE